MQLTATTSLLSSDPSFKDLRFSNDRYIGVIDPIEGTTISGWSISRNDPDRPIVLRVTIDGSPAGEAACDRLRPDLAHLGLHLRLVGFSYDIGERFQDGYPHTLPILLPDDTLIRFQGPNGAFTEHLRYTAQPFAEIQGVVDGLTDDVIKGWVVRTTLKSGSVEGRIRLQVFCDGVPVGQITADQPRMDVARHLDCEPEVGFVFRLPAHCRNGQEFRFGFKALPEEQHLSNSPTLVQYRAVDRTDAINALRISADQLCVQVWAVQRQIRELIPAVGSITTYGAWAKRYYGKLRARLSQPMLDEGPMISIVMPTYKPALNHFIAAVDSVIAQTYSNWELIIVDDGSKSPQLKACIKEYATREHRICTIFSSRNRGISAASNAALRKARGSFILLFDHDDLLVDVAVETLAREALLTGARIVYADEDKIDEFGALSEPNLKPDWNYRLLLGVNYICHPLLVERGLLQAAGSFRSEYDGAQDHDLLLRLAELVEPARVQHVPEILYHWRKSATSTAGSGEAKPYAVEAGRKAITDHLNRRGFLGAKVKPIGRNTAYSLAWGLRADPTVTIVIPFRDETSTTERCLTTLLKVTDYDNYKVVLVDNGSVTPEAQGFCRSVVSDPRVIVRRVDEPFNFSRLNNVAVRENPADYYLFLNNDVFVAQPDWLRLMLEEALADPKVAIVGSKLLYPDGTIQHAGVVLGVGGVADHAFKHLSGDNGGYLARAWCAQQYSAVTAACMLCRADAFMEVGGFDEHDLFIAFNDIDLCLKVGALGWRVIWTPAVVAEHHESLSRGDDMAPEKTARFFYENYVMLERWKDVLLNDPFYNPHFSRDGGLFADLR